MEIQQQKKICSLLQSGRLLYKHFFRLIALNAANKIDITFFFFLPLQFLFIAIRYAYVLLLLHPNDKDFRCQTEIAKVSETKWHFTSARHENIVCCAECKINERDVQTDGSTGRLDMLNNWKTTVNFYMMAFVRHGISKCYACAWVHKLIIVMIICVTFDYVTEVHLY